MARTAITLSDQKMEAFLTRLAREGMAASTQNQAFNAALFFYREILKQEIGEVNSLRAKQHGNPRHCPTQEEVLRLLAAVADIHLYPTRLIVHLPISTSGPDRAGVHFALRAGAG